MDAKKVTNFYSELEKLATYNNESISEEEFINNIIEIKQDLKNKGKEIPEIFELVRTKADFRSGMQKYGGYQERREKLRENLYPIIEMYEQQILNKGVSDNKTSIKELNGYLKLNKMQIKTKYGIINILNLETKSGGNGTVYFGNMSGENVAVKVLINNTKEKLNRFLCEYGNVILKLSDKDGIVKMYFYDEIVINNSIYPIICMKKYENKLLYNENYSEDEIIDIVKQILNATKSIHDAGIIHRDLKPDNILISNDKIHIADFGIAYYNPDFFDKTGHTTESERLANYDFSAPEQRNSKIKPEKTMDIYAIGQIIQWLVFGVTTKGTHRKNIYKKYNTPRMHFLDNIVDKCLNDDPKERYQSINDILNEISQYNEDKKEIKNETAPMKITSNAEKNANQELKEALKDIMDKICFSYYGEYDEETEKNFCLHAPLSDEFVIEFLERIPYNIDKLEFFDKVGFSKFINEYEASDIAQVEKTNFIRLSQLYQKIKKNEDYKLQQAFIEYVKTRLNENFELPF